MKRRDLHTLTRIYAEALRLAVGDDRVRGMMLLDQACENLGVEMPVIACDVPK